MYDIHIYILYSVHRYRLVVHFRKNYIIYEETKIKKYWYLHLPPPYCDISGEVFEDKGQNLTFRITFDCQKTCEFFFQKNHLKYQFRRTFFDNFNFRNDNQLLMTCLKVIVSQIQTDIWASWLLFSKLHNWVQPNSSLNV